MPAGDPVWGPLEKAALLSRHHPDLPSFHEWEFMYMYVQGEDGPYRTHAYKHRDTRAYIHLDDQGRPRGPGGFQALADAIDGLRLDEFDANPPLYRSTPPEQWPADDPHAVAAVMEEWSR